MAQFFPTKIADEKSSNLPAKIQGAWPPIFVDFQTLIRLDLAQKIGAGRATRYVLSARANH